MAERGELYPSYGVRVFDSPEEAARNGLTGPPLTALASYADDDMAFVILSDPDGDLWEAIVRLSLDGWVFLGGGNVGQSDTLHAVRRHRGEELGFVGIGGPADDNDRAVVEFHGATYDATVQNGIFVWAKNHVGFPLDRWPRRLADPPGNVSPDRKS